MAKGEDLILEMPDALTPYAALLFSRFPEVLLALGQPSLSKDFDLPPSANSFTVIEETGEYKLVQVLLGRCGSNACWAHSAVRPRRGTTSKVPIHQPESDKSRKSSAGFQRCQEGVDGLSASSSHSSALSRGSGRRSCKPAGGLSRMAKVAEADATAVLHDEQGKPDGFWSAPTSASVRTAGAKSTASSNECSKAFNCPRGNNIGKPRLSRVFRAAPESLDAPNSATTAAVEASTSHEVHVQHCSGRAEEQVHRREQQQRASLAPSAKPNEEHRGREGQNHYSIASPRDVAAGFDRNGRSSSHHDASSSSAREHAQQEAMREQEVARNFKMSSWITPVMRAEAPRRHSTSTCSKGGSIPEEGMEDYSKLVRKVGAKLAGVGNTSKKGSTALRKSSSWDSPDSKTVRLIDEPESPRSPGSYKPWEDAAISTPVDTWGVQTKDTAPRGHAMITWKATKQPAPAASSAHDTRQPPAQSGSSLDGQEEISDLGSDFVPDIAQMKDNDRLLERPRFQLPRRESTHSETAFSQSCTEDSLGLSPSPKTKEDLAAADSWPVNQESNGKAELAH